MKNSQIESSVRWYYHIITLSHFLKYKESIDDQQCSCSWCHFTDELYGFPFSRDRSEYLVPLCGIGDLRYTCSLVMLHFMNCTVPASTR
jgi:hypothetical protein